MPHGTRETSIISCRSLDSIPLVPIQRGVTAVHLPEREFSAGSDQARLLESLKTHGNRRPLRAHRRRFLRLKSRRRHLPSLGSQRYRRSMRCCGVERARGGPPPPGRRRRGCRPRCCCSSGALAPAGSLSERALTGHPPRLEDFHRPRKAVVGATTTVGVPSVAHPVSCPRRSAAAAVPSPSPGRTVRSPLSGSTHMGTRPPLRIRAATHTPSPMTPPALD